MARVLAGFLDNLSELLRGNWRTSLAGFLAGLAELGSLYLPEWREVWVALVALGLALLGVLAHDGKKAG